MFLIYGGITYLIVRILFGFIGTNRRIGFWGAFFVCMIFTPVIGLFVALDSGKVNAKGCQHCGNQYNEAEFCGICGKNEDGYTREQVNDRLNSINNDT